MEIKPLKLAGAYEITLAPRFDERGYFLRVFDEKLFREHGLTTAWVQENQSRSTRKHLIRGLHFQAPPHAETKLVRVVVGAILDVFVDIRRSSPTYGQWASIELTADNFKMAYIPKGCAHAFCTLSDEAVVQYKVDACYAPGAEGGLRWNDPAFNIPWPTREPLLSAKDQAWPSFAGFESPFP